MALPTPPAYSQSIPNNPFYSAPTFYIQGVYGPLVIGSGLTVDYANGTINSSGGGGGGVTSAIAGAGIGVSSATGAVTFTNTGVRSLTAGAGIALSGSTGAVTVTATTLGTVTGILTGAGLTGGPISTSGTIALAPSGVTANSYTNPTITVDQYGRVITAASNTVVNTVSVTAPLTITGTSNPTIGIPNSSITTVGAVQLSNAVNDPASICAASTAAVKTAYDVAIQAIPKTCITAKGTLITGTAASTPVALPVGTDGQVLVASSAAVGGLCWGSPSTTPVATPSTFGTVYGQTNFADTFLGERAGEGLKLLTTGCAVTAIGYCAARFLGAGSDASTAIGSSALAAPTCSRYVTAVGDRAMCGAGNTAENVAIGTMALRAITANCNTAVGALAGFDLTGGSNNVFVGRNAACANTSGSCNVVIGPNTTTSGLTVSCELVVGYGAGQNWLTGNGTKAIKPGAGIIDCTNSCGTAGQVLMSNGANAVCWGSVSSPANATPTVAGVVKGCITATNVGLGCNVFSALTTGVRNVAIGNCALCSITNADENVVLGNCAGKALTGGSYNIALGHSALCAATSAQFNIAIGCESFSSSGFVGSRNTAVGNFAGACLNAGYRNVFVGEDTGVLLANGSCNTFAGSAAGGNSTAGSFNIALGAYVDLPNLTGSCQLAIGYFDVGTSSSLYWLTGCSNKNIKPGAGILDCAGSAGTANQVLVSTGANALQWKSVNSALAAPNYGSFNSTATQTVTTINTGKAVTLTQVAASNFSLNGGGTQIIAAVAGTYNIQISLQIISTSGGGGNVEVWFVKNGTAITNSNTRYAVKNANEAEVAALNLVETFAAGDNIQVFWASDNSNMTLATLSSTMSGPAIPSAIVTVVPVGA